MKNIIYLSLFLLACCYSLQAKATNSKLPLICTDTYESFNYPNVCDSLISPSGKVWKSTGVFMDTILNTEGCDSVMTFNITVGFTTTSSVVLTGLCDSLVSPTGSGKVWYTSGMYKDTIANASGCDSIITFDLTIGVTTTSSIVITNLCDSLISPSGSGKKWYTSGVYKDTIPNQFGCDSLMTFNLTFGTSSSFVLTNLCDSLVSPSGSGKKWYATGIYQDTITNAKGCDSVMTFNLTFGTSSSFVLTNLCDSLVSPSGSGKTWYTTGVYKDTIDNAKGCDSVMTFDLTFGTTASFNMPNVCDSLISPSGKIWKTTGIYKDTIDNAKGCDSVMTFNLVIGKTTTASFIDYGICDYKISPSGKLWNTDGIYLDTIPNVSGCDSIMTFDLTFKYSTSASFTPPSICDSWLSPSGKTVTTSGVFMDTIANAVGCDSVMTFNLTIKYSTSASFTPAICDSLVVASGKVYKASGVIKDTVANTVGCDSVITYNLTILNPTPNTSVWPASGLVCSGDTVIASGTCANGVLKWYNDASHTSLKSVGASDTTYVAVPGNFSVYAFCEGTGGCLSVNPSVVSYSVGGIPMNPSSGSANPNMTCAGDTSILSVSGCSGGAIEWYDNSNGTGSPIAYGFTTKVAPTSTKSYFAYCVMPGGCKSAFGTTVTVTVDPCNTTSIQNNALDNKIKLFPNPFKDHIMVTISEDFLKEDLILTIFNSIGKEVKVINQISSSSLAIDLSGYDKGLYIINVKANKTNTNEIIKVIKQ